MKALLFFLSSLMLLIAPAQAEVMPGEPAPAIEITDVNAEHFKLSDHLGSPVVLEWTNHKCPFVVKFHKSNKMQDLQKEYTDNGVKWVRIISSAPGKQGHVTPEEAKQIIADQKIHATTTLLDESGEIGRAYGAKTTPHMYVINAEGVVVYKGAIDNIASADPADIEKAENYVVAALESLSSNSPIEVSNTQSYGCGVKY